MFAIRAADFSGEVLDCAGGPASFNAEATARGHRVVSCDPLYRLSAGEIAVRIDATFDELVARAKANRDRFVWHDVGSPEQLGEARMAAMRRFLEDFPRGLEQGRYVAGGLPHLGFDDARFGLALCSHFLFTYSEQLSTGFHVAAIGEMCRVAAEVRVFPLLEGYGGPSPLLEPVIQELRRTGYQAVVREVSYEFQRGGNELLSVVGPRLAREIQHSQLDL